MVELGCCWVLFTAPQTWTIGCGTEWVTPWWCGGDVVMVLWWCYGDVVVILLFSCGDVVLIQRLFHIFTVAAPKLVKISTS